MKLTADESVDKSIATALRNNNFEVFYITEESPSIEDVDFYNNIFHEVLNLDL
jgi:hypothetical protein